MNKSSIQFALIFMAYQYKCCARWTFVLL